MPSLVPPMSLRKTQLAQHFLGGILANETWVTSSSGLQWHLSQHYPEHSSKAAPLEVLCCLVRNLDKLFFNVCFIAFPIYVYD